MVRSTRSRMLDLPLIRLPLIRIVGLLAFVVLVACDTASPQSDLEEVIDSGFAPVTEGSPPSSNDGWPSAESGVERPEGDSSGGDDDFGETEGDESSSDSYESTDDGPVEQEPSDADTDEAPTQEGSESTGGEEPVEQPSGESTGTDEGVCGEHDAPCGSHDDCCPAEEEPFSTPSGGYCDAGKCVVNLAGPDSKQCDPTQNLNTQCLGAASCFLMDKGGPDYCCMPEGFGCVDAHDGFDCCSGYCNNGVCDIL